MADQNTVWCYATDRGQLPNGVWANAGDGPFEVNVDSVNKGVPKGGQYSKRWMKPAPAAEQKALAQAKADAIKAKIEAGEDPDAMIEQLKAQVSDLTNQLAAAREATALANAQKGALEGELKVANDALRAAQQEVETLKASPPAPEAKSAKAK